MARRWKHDAVVPPAYAFIFVVNPLANEDRAFLVNEHLLAVLRRSVDWLPLHAAMVAR
jgi:hypothetical protein